MLLAAIANRLCGALVDAGLGERSGPLVASMLLFLPPSVGMGMVSPFAIRLATQSVASVGKISGALYALSTAGSIAGTLLTTFVLIPLIGVSAILKGLAVGPVAGFGSHFAVLETRAGRRRRAGIADSGIFPLAGIARDRSGEAQATIVVEVDTPYHHISVVDSRGIRAHVALRSL